MRALMALLLTAGLAAGAAQSAPAAYTLQPEASTVGFETDFGADKISGRMPVTRADLKLDFQHVAGSSVAVTLDVAGAQASFPFAAQAMKGPKVLDSGEFPTITFQSTSVKADGDGAAVAGNMTIRGVTKPATLHAVIYRQQGTVEGDLRLLTIRLTGTVLRSEFGATGWADSVGDQVRLDILARIQRVD